MTARSFTLGELCLSPLNVRTNEEDANTTEALESSIEEDGLIFPLIVHPMPQEGSGAGLYGVLAGGRRFRAITRLIESGRFVPDWPIDCIIRDVGPGQITKLSLAENMLRRQLRPYEVHAAIAKAQERGASIDEIAASIGQRVLWVRQQMRLGSLAPEIFTEYAEGRLDADQAAAYAATEDQDLQRATFAHFRGHIGLKHDDRAIRAFLKVGDREGERLLAFVGPVIYRAAGGRYELDLFADGPERGRIADEQLLRKLAEEKLAEIRAALRIRAGRDDLRFQAEPPQFGGTPDYALEIQPTEMKIAGTLALMVPEGDIVATLSIDDDGEARARWWWASRKAKAAASKAPPTSPPAPRSPGSAISTPAFQGEPELPRGPSFEALTVARTVRREILRALLVEEANNGDGDPLAMDYLVWGQLRQVINGDGAHVTGLLGDGEAIEHDATGLAARHLRAIEAHRRWNDAIEDIAQRPFITEPDGSIAFAHYVSASLPVRARAAAVLVGLMLARSANADGLRISVHDRLADLADVTRDAPAILARPTPEFLGLFPKADRLALVQPHVDASELRHISILRDREISRAIADRLSAIDWVHPLLAFPEPEMAKEPA